MSIPLFVQQEILINASAQLIWNLLTNAELSKQWVSEFGISKGYIESDWQKGSQIFWKDGDGKTLVKGELYEVTAPHSAHFGVVDINHGPAEGTTDQDGITYLLAENGDKTTLKIKQGDFGKMPDGAKYHAATENIWQKVLAKIKFLAEEMQKLQDEGYQEIRICPLPPNEDFGEHTHDLATVHLILKGNLTITENGQTQTFQPGDKVEFPINTTHKALGDDTDGDMIVGVKNN